MVTLEELRRSSAQVGKSVHRTTISTTISRAIHKSGRYGRVAMRKPLLEESRKKVPLAICHKPPGRHSKHVEEVAPVRWDQIELFGPNENHSVWWEPNTVHRPEHTIPPWNMVVGSIILWGFLSSTGKMDGTNTGRSLKKTVLVCKTLEIRVEVHLFFGWKGQT